jgi:hypothetical protein
MFFSHVGVIDDNNVFDDENMLNENNADEEHFQIQSAEKANNFVLVNTRMDYQYRSDTLDNTCLYDFVSALYKKKMNASDLKYLSQSSMIEQEQESRKGRPPNERFPYQKQHPQNRNTSYDEIS